LQIHIEGKQELTYLIQLLDVVSTQQEENSTADFSGIFVRA